MKKILRVLPNEDIPRKIIDNDIMKDICNGCSKLFPISANENICESYANPMIWSRYGDCPINIKIKKEKIKKINPIKFSRRNR